MPRLIIPVLIITILFSCNTKQQDNSKPPAEPKIISVPDSANIITDSHYFWNSDWDTKKGLVMRKVSPLYEDSLTPSILIQKINSLYPGIQLRLRNISNDTIFIAIDKSMYLTSQIGSSGAEGYLAEVTYNLTEINNINYVDLSFKQGDHASPGTYARTDFVRSQR